MRKTPFLRISILKTTVYQGRLGTPIAKVEKKRGGFCRQVLSQHPVAQHHDASHDDARLRRGRPRGSRQQGLASYLLQDSARGAFLKTTQSLPPFKILRCAFYQDRLGTTIGKALPPKRPFVFTGERLLDRPLWQGEKPARFVHFQVTMVILPRQARVKRRKNSKKLTVLL